jgi:hypothetical protein
MKRHQPLSNQALQASTLNATFSANQASASTITSLKFASKSSGRLLLACLLVDKSILSSSGSGSGGRITILVSDLVNDELVVHKRIIRKSVQVVLGYINSAISLIMLLEML